MILAELAVRIGAGRVEVPQRDRADAVRALEVRQRALDRELGLAVRVDRPRADAVSSIGVSTARRKRAPSTRTRSGATSSAIIASSTVSVPRRWCGSSPPDSRTDSPTDSHAAKCMTASRRCSRMAARTRAVSWMSPDDDRRPRHRRRRFAVTGRQIVEDDDVVVPRAAAP